MKLAAWSAELQPQIDAEMRRAVDSCLVGQHEEMRTLLAYHLSWEGPGANQAARGKRLRPLLLLLCTAACGGDWRNALPAAAAVELVHNFSLIHDDIEDRSLLRRGRQTVWAMWGVPLAINAGDALFALANRAILRLEETVGAEVAIQAISVYLDTCIALTGGQHLDISAENLPTLTLLDYGRMINGKTAALISASAEIGALVGGASAERRSAFQRFGSSLGLSFQAQDDWLGVWGDEDEIGKSSASDLLTGKKSLPIVYGLEQQGEFARQWSKGPVSIEEVTLMRDLLSDEGAEEFTRMQVQQWTDDAMTALDDALDSQHHDAASAIRELVGQLIEREY